MKSPEQLKGLIRNIAIEKNISAQEILQAFMFERLIERISISKHKNHLILKGGLLISSIMGIEERTTMDMDTTLKGIAVNEATIIAIVKSIICIDVNDGIKFKYIRLEAIRNHDEYNNYSVSISANYGKISVPLKIDFTTGDSIVPREIEYDFNLMFTDKKVLILAYPLELILAEKLETVVSRSVINTRSRDFYDIYVLYQLKSKEIRWDELKKAIIATAKKRETLEEVKAYKEIISDIKTAEIVNSSWLRYQNNNMYAQDIDLFKTLETIQNIFDKIFEV